MVPSMIQVLMETIAPIESSVVLSVLLVFFWSKCVVGMKGNRGSVYQKVEIHGLFDEKPKNLRKHPLIFFTFLGGYSL